MAEKIEKIDIVLRNLVEVEDWLAGMYEETVNGGHVHMAEPRLRDAMFLLRHSIDQIEVWKKEQG